MAEEQIVTHIVANADFSNLIADVNRVTASLSEMQQKLAASNKALDNQIKVINNSFAETLRSTGQYSTHFLTLTSDVEKFGRNLDAGRLKLRDYFRVYQDHQKTSTGLIRDLAKQQTQLQNAILQPLGRNAQGLMQFNVHVPRGLDLIKNKTNLAKLELQIMNKVIQDGAVQLINWGKNTQWAGRQLTVGLTLPLTMFGKAAADAFKTADQELTRLTKVYGDVAGTSAEELSNIRKEVSETARELASAMGVNFSETIALAADIAATGKTGNELLGALTETTRLAVLGEVDRAEAMKATLAIQTAFKQNTDELTESINFLNAVENQTSTTLNDLVTAIPKAGPVVKSLGGDIQDLALYLTAMREGGINASESANALKSGLASLINPTKQTVGVMSDFGIDILGMVNKNAGNTTSLLFDLQGALDNLDPLQKAQAIEQLFGKFQFARISALLNNLGRQGSQTLQVLDLMGESAANLESVAGRELAAVTESAAGRYRRAIEGLKADLAGVGEQFLNISTNLINFVDGIVDFANKLPKPVKQALTLVGGITALAGPLIMLTGVLANFFGYIIKGLSHMRALFKGGEGFRLLTPEILAAERAGSLIEKTFYNDAQAAAVLNTALKNLIDSFTVLQSKAATGQFSVNPAVSTMAGNAIVASSAAGRVVDPNNPFLGPIGTRASAHMNPRDPNNPASLFGMVPSTGPVNLRVGRNPMFYSGGQTPTIPGLTAFGGASAGIYAPEAARWHSLMATMGMQTRQEMEQLKDVIASGGAVSSDIMNTFDDILPLMSNVTDNAAKQTQLIVSEMQAGKITLQQARERIMQLNAQVEAELIATAQTFAAQRGRTIDVTKVPGLDQPVVNLAGSSNMRELFHKERSARMMEALGRATRTRMYGGPYNIATTRPQGLNQGGKVYTMAQGNIVPGPNVNADVVPALLTPGEFVVNREATARNLPLLQAINGAGSRGPGFNNGTRNPLSGLQRGHISNDLSAFLMYMDEDVNQRMVRGRTYKGFDGITGLEIARSFETLQARTGMHPAAILKEVAYEMGGDPGLVDDFYNELIKDLRDPNNATKIFGGTRGSSFEDFADQRLTRLRLITLPDGRNLHDELRRVKTVRDGKTVGLEMDGRPYGGSNVLPVAPSRRASRQSSALGRAFLGTRGGFRGRQIPALFRFNAGGMVPGYAGGGKVLRYQTGGGPIPELKFAGPELIAAAQSVGLIPKEQRRPMSPLISNVLSMGGGMAGSLAGERIGGGMGSMVGFLAAQSATSALLNRQMGSSLNIASKLKAAFIGLPGPAKALAVVGALALGVKSINDRINEHRRIVDQGFAPTEDTINKLNLRFEKTVDVLNQVQENMRAMQETGQALYRTTTGIGVPGVSLSIEEFDQLSERVTSEFPDLVEVFNKAKPDEVAAKAEQLKAQFIAGGMGAQDATNFIYTLIKASNDANLALSAIGAEGFRSIVDGATAAKSAITTFESLASDLNVDQIPEAFDTARNAINGMRRGLVGTKDEAGNVVTEAQALNSAFEAIKNTAEGNKELTFNQLNELKKQNPVLKDILGSAENLSSVYAKTELYARGITTNLKQLSAEQAALSLSIFTAMETEFRSTEGPFKALARDIQSLEKSSDVQKITRAVQRSQDQIKKEIELRQKNIQKIKEEADARLQALDRERDDEDALLEIKKLQLQYQNQMASGNLEAAAQTAIDIQQRVGDQQSELARRAIEDKANQRIKEEEAAIERLQKELDRSQKKIDQANKKAEENAKNLAESQQLMMDTVGAMQMARDGIDESERSVINSVKKRLEDLGYGNIARRISPDAVVENPRQADAAAEGKMRSPIENLFERTFGKVIDSTSGALKVTDVNEARNIVRGTPSGVIDVKTMGAPGGFAQNYVTETQLTRAGLKAQKGTVFTDSSGRSYRVTGPGLQPNTFSVIPKFDKGINVVPEDMLAIIHKNEAVIPAKLNPFNPNNNGTMGSSISVGTVVMQFPDTPANGRQMFAEFKEAMRVDNLKKGGTIRI